MSTKKYALKVYLKPEERTHVAHQAAQTRLSMSTFAKRVCLGYEIKSTTDQQAVLALTRACGELGRQGGLLKMALKEGLLQRDQHIRHLINDLEAAKDELLKQAAQLQNDSKAH